MMGVPVRLELGPKDYANEAVRLVSRVDGKKEDVKWQGLPQFLQEKLEQIQQFLFERAKKRFDDSVVTVYTLEEAAKIVETKKIVLVPWCVVEPRNDDTITDDEQGKDKQQ